jgi:hypothetical protein
MSTPRLLSLIKSYVAVRKWKIAQEDNDSVAMIFGETSSEKVDDHCLLISGREEQNDINFKVMCCQFVPSGKRAKLAEFCTRATYGLK